MAGVDEVGESREKKDAYQIYQEMQASLDQTEGKPVALPDGHSPGRLPEGKDLPIGAGSPAPLQAVHEAYITSSSETITESKNNAPLVVAQMQAAQIVGAAISMIRVASGKTEGKDR